MKPVIAIVFAEIWYRRWSAICAVLVVASAIASVVFFVLISDLAAHRTQIIQRDIGLNMRIIPAETELESYWIRGYSEGVMEQSILQRVEEQNVANRLVPMLQRTIPWGTGEAILTGVGEELFGGGQKMKPVFGSTQKEAEGLSIGSVAASRRSLTEGDSVEVLGNQFTIQRVLGATGSLDDVRVYGNLTKVQEMLGLPGQLNEIRALECHCGSDVADPEAYIQSVLEPLLPGTKVIRQDRMAEARRKQRQLIDQMGLVATPILTTLAALILLGLTFQNVNQRKAEIGLLSSIGHSPIQITVTLWLRSVVLGLVGGVLGAWLGTQLVEFLVPTLLGGSSSGAELNSVRMLMGGAIGSLIASCGAMIPAVLAARSDPATTLRGS